MTFIKHCLLLHGYTYISIIAVISLYEYVDTNEFKELSDTVLPHTTYYSPLNHYAQQATKVHTKTFAFLRNIQLHMAS